MGVGDVQKSGGLWAVARKKLVLPEKYTTLPQRNYSKINFIQVLARENFAFLNEKIPREVEKLKNRRRKRKKSVAAKLPRILRTSAGHQHVQMALLDERDAKCARFSKFM